VDPQRMGRGGVLPRSEAPGDPDRGVPVGYPAEIELDAGLVEGDRLVGDVQDQPHAFISGPTVISNAPSDSRLYRIASATKSKSSGSTATRCCAAARLTRDSGLSAL